MTNRDSRSLIEDLLVAGLVDWISAADVYSAAMGAPLVKAVELRALAVGLISEMLAGGLAVPGDVTDEGHTPWECSTWEAIGRISEDWFRRAEAHVFPGEVVWLNTTPKGEAIARAVLEREEEVSS